MEAPAAQLIKHFAYVAVAVIKSRIRIPEFRKHPFLAVRLKESGHPF
jgi:hypothetical protein